MLPDRYRWIVQNFEPEGEPWYLHRIALELESAGNLEGAATVHDRAFGLAPEEPEIVAARASLLDRLRVVEHGLTFRYIPAGPFLMGSREGEPDEQPLHPVWLSPFWMTEVPVSWAAHARLLGWGEPPYSFPPELPEGQGFNREAFHLNEANKIRMQYCEDLTFRARDWHAHAIDPTEAGPQQATSTRLFGSVPRTDPRAPRSYEHKPMIAVSWQEAEELAHALSTPAIDYDLPTEAEWEKAARGGRIGARHAWGDQPPSPELCDFGRFAEFSIQPSRTFPPNGYGLFAMNGGVWEWTRDWYDRDYYQQSPEENPRGPESGEEKVIRGGSWADCPEVITVTFRASRSGSNWRDGTWGEPRSPNIGFRLVRRLKQG
jgi:formylglycine-generating enzyme required for sulfatase activity